jgi:protein O-mannosyl-transferase
MSTLEHAHADKVPPASEDCTIAERRRAGVLTALFLVSITALAYGRLWVEDIQFLNADDDQYVTENPHVRSGLSAANLWWAATAFHSANWHPLTWLSLQLDAQLFGLNPRAFHLVNVALHAANAVLLFLVLQRLTGAFWRSAAVAAFFAVHPVHVESVAWVSERKDVLSALFFLLTLWAYAGYAERTSWGRYLKVMILFALGLMAKPMLVTLPFVLLLLDYWPLGRWAQGSVSRLFREKLPLLALAGAASVLTVQAQARMIQSTEAVPIAVRLANALVSYVDYLRATFWPVDLAFFYPLVSEDLVWWRVGGCALVLGAVTALAVVQKRNRPYFLVGWLWFIGMLVPVIGLVQLALQARADRYTYLPSIGIFIVVAWLSGDLAAGRKLRRAVSLSAACLLAVCVAATWVQSGHWRNSVTLWQRTLAVTRNNGGAHLGLAFALDKQGKTTEAQSHFLRAVELLDNAAAHSGLGNHLLANGRLEEARRHLALAVDLFPGAWKDRYNLALLLIRLGKSTEARQQLLHVVERAPDFGGAHYHLGRVHARLGALDEAQAELTLALLSKPDHVEARYQLGSVLFRQGKLQQAWEQFDIILVNDPAHVPARLRQGVILAKAGKSDLALKRFRDVLDSDPQNVVLLDTLAATYAEIDRFDDAVAIARKALELAQAAMNAALARQIQGRLESYRQRQRGSQRLDTR